MEFGVNMKKLISIIVIGCFFLASNASAIEQVKKGQKAPENGWFFTDKEELKSRRLFIKKNGKILTLEAKNDGLVLQLKLTEAMKSKYHDAYNETDEQLEKVLKKKKGSPLLFFVLGMSTMTVAVWGASKLD